MKIFRAGEKPLRSVLCKPQRNNRIPMRKIMNSQKEGPGFPVRKKIRRLSHCFGGLPSTRNNLENKNNIETKRKYDVTNLGNYY